MAQLAKTHMSGCRGLSTVHTVGMCVPEDLRDLGEGQAVSSEAGGEFWGPGRWVGSTGTPNIG